MSEPYAIPIQFTLPSGQRHQLYGQFTLEELKRIIETVDLDSLRALIATFASPRLPKPEGHAAFLMALQEAVRIRLETAVAVALGVEFFENDRSGNLGLAVRSAVPA